MIPKSIVACGFLLGFLALTSLVGAVPSVVSHQGRLLGADDQPVADGNYVLVYSLFTEPDGGIAVWTENQDVTTKGGLFSVMLGSHNPLSLSLFDNDSLYLQTQVSGEAPLLPRLHVGSVPFAAKTGRISGDIVTTPGTVTVSNTSGNGAVKLTTTDLAAATIVLEADLDGDGVMDNTITDSVDAAGARRRLSNGNIGSSGEDGVEIAARPSGASLRAINTKGNGSTFRTSMDASDSANVRCDSDSDGDGVPENDASLRVTPTTSGVAIKTKGTGAEANRTVSVSSGTDVSAANMACDIDDDGDGVPESSLEQRCDLDSVVLRAESNDGGSSSNYNMRVRVDNLETKLINLGLLSATAISSTCDATSAKHAINTKGTGGNRVTSVSSTTDEASASIACDIDDDGDGIPELGVSSICDDTGAQQIVYKKGLNAVNVRRAITSSTDDIQALHYIDDDSDDDGVMDRGISSSCGATGAKHSINTKGTGANNGRVLSVTSSTDESSASVACDIDDDSDGIAERSAWQKVDNTGCARALELDLDHNGLPDVGNLSSADESRSILKSYFERGDRPTQSQFAVLIDASGAEHAINTKGTGSAGRAVSVASRTDESNASVACDIDDEGDGIADRQVSSSVDSAAAQVLAEGSGIQTLMKVVNKGIVKGVINIASANRVVVGLDSDGDGYLDNSLGIGVDATHRLDVIGGAYCDGTNWVNASDAIVKENFIDVNGAELLDKIDQLPIQQWNYKDENADLKHIGPTAQDFKNVFGVGSDGKSISTIDPSGIALAAIKELHKENLALKGRITDLQLQLDDLKQKSSTADEMQAQITKLSAMVKLMMSTWNANEGATRMTSSTLSK